MQQNAPFSRVRTRGEVSVKVIVKHASPSLDRYRAGNLSVVARVSTKFSGPHTKKYTN